MKDKLDKLHLIDLEATCWDNTTGEQAAREIIQIGYAELDLKTKEITANSDIMVCPNFLPLSKFCTELTGIKTQDVSAQPKLIDALRQIPVPAGSSFVWGSWGDFDKHQFERECYNKRLRNPFQRARHINIKLLTAIALGLDYEVGMAEALKAIDLPLEGTHHNAYWDTYNIAKISQKVLKCFDQLLV